MGLISQTLSATAREIKDLLLPRGCAGCDAPDEVLCDACAANFEQSIIRSHAHTGSTYPSFACSEYRGESRRAILRWKDHGDEELTTPFCRLMSKRVRRDDSMGLLRVYVGSRSPILVVPAPSTMQSMRRRGRCHMMPLAKAVADELQAWGMPATAVQLLSVAGGTNKAVQQSRAIQRSQRLQGRLHVKQQLPYGTHAILVDDIVTTGSTLTSCGRALSDAGITPIAAYALASVAGRTQSSSI